MFFYIGILIIAASCSLISIRTLVGYSNIKLVYKVLLSVVICCGWFFPVLVCVLRNIHNISPETYNRIYTGGYALFGFVFILFTMLMLRDVIWYGVYGIAKLLRIHTWNLNPKNITALDYANVLVFFFSIALSFYAYKEGTKVPEVKEITVESSRIKKDLKAVQLADLHISRSTSLQRLQDIVNQVNLLTPDVIFMTGDIIDDDVNFLRDHLKILSNLSAPQGIYSSSGNHEFYNGLGKWLFEFKKMGIITLFNHGVLLKDSNIFVAGIPDNHTAIFHPTFNVNFVKALRGSQPDNFKILLSHNPDMVDNITSVNFGLQLSGHTHGGQVFPFHALAAHANKYLAGEYKVNDVKLYVSRGAGTWGPTMRLLAPSEITVINLKSKK